MTTYLIVVVLCCASGCASRPLLFEALHDADPAWLDVVVYRHDGRSADCPYEREVLYKAELACVSRSTGRLLLRHHDASSPNGRFGLPVPVECYELTLRVAIRPSYDLCDSVLAEAHLNIADHVHSVDVRIACD